MSALIRESHANNQTPLFLSASGGVVSGDVDITGNLTVGGTGIFGGNLDTSGNLTAAGDLDVSGNVVVDGTLGVQGVVSTENDVNLYTAGGGTPALQFIGVVGPPDKIEMRTDGGIEFSTLNLATVPQTTLVLSNTPDADVLTVGGDLIATRIQGIGPPPVSLITSTKNIAPAPISPAPATAFAVDVSVPTTTGGEYDVMTRGLVTLAGGVPDVDDVVNVTLDAGTSVATGAVWTYQFRPSAVSANGYWAIRDRIRADAVVPSIGVSVQVFLNGASTAVYNVSQIQFDVTRVI